MMLRFSDELSLFRQEKLPLIYLMLLCKILVLSCWVSKIFLLKKSWNISQWTLKMCHFWVRLNNFIHKFSPSWKKWDFTVKVIISFKICQSFRNFVENLCWNSFLNNLKNLIYNKLVKLFWQVSILILQISFFFGEFKPIPVIMTE